ncbi:MAG: hypothetical protein AAFQ43_04865, partial [Bacteroidota bacterium]
LAHEGPAPEAQPAGASGVTTLRHTHGAHSHDGHTHVHGDHTHAAPSPLRFARALAPEAHAEASGDGFHEHGGVLHRHDAPADDPAPVVTLVLDDHRLLGTPILLAPLAPDADRDARGQPVASVERTVETPPPIG